MPIVLAGHGGAAVLQRGAVVRQHGVAGVAGSSAPQAPGEVTGPAHFVLHLQGAEQDVVVGVHLSVARGGGGERGGEKTEGGDVRGGVHMTSHMTMFLAGF